MYETDINMCKKCTLKCITNMEKYFKKPILIVVKYLVRIIIKYYNRFDDFDPIVRDQSEVKRNRTTKIKYNILVKNVSMYIWYLVNTP